MTILNFSSVCRSAQIYLGGVPERLQLVRLIISGKLL